MRQRIVVIVLVSIIVTLLGLAIVSRVSVRESIEHDLNHQIELARIVASHFDQLLEANLSRLFDVSHSAQMNLSDEDMEPEKGVLKTAYQYSLFSEGVFVANSDGKILLSYPQYQVNSVGEQLSQEIRNVVRDKTPSVTGIKVVQGTERPTLVALVPLRDASGNVTSVIGGEMNPATYMLDNVIRAVPAGKETIIELVETTGVVVASNSSTRVFFCSDRNKVLEHLVSEKKESVIMCHRCHVEGWRAEASEQTRTEDMLAFAPLKRAPWGVTVRTPKGKIFASSATLKKRFLLLGLIAVGGSLLLAAGMSRSIVNPIRTLIAATKKIAGGKLDEPIRLVSRDEIGELGRSLDLMRRQLASYLGEVEKANAGLEQRVGERTAELQRSRERLANLLKKVIGAQEEERRRVARDLHDETSQSLTALGVRLESASLALSAGTLTADGVRELRNITGQLIDGINRLIQDLRPPVLDDLGLESAVRWLLERHLRENGVQYKLVVSEKFKRKVLEQEKLLDQKAGLMLFRIVQEAVINVMKHAKAKNVAVAFGLERNLISVTVSDDGVGFNPAGVLQEVDVNKKGGFGLAGVRERVSLLDGAFDIESAPNRGTTVSITIPVHSLGLEINE